MWERWHCIVMIERIRLFSVYMQAINVTGSVKTGIIYTSNIIALKIYSSCCEQAINIQI